MAQKQVRGEDEATRAKNETLAQLLLGSKSRSLGRWPKLNETLAGAPCRERNESHWQSLDRDQGENQKRPRRMDGPDRCALRSGGAPWADRSHQARNGAAPSGKQERRHKNWEIENTSTQRGKRCGRRKGSALSAPGGRNENLSETGRHAWRSRGQRWQRKIETWSGRWIPAAAAGPERKRSRQRTRKMNQKKILQRLQKLEEN
jgi:hypothetical protein